MDLEMKIIIGIIKIDDFEPHKKEENSILKDGRSKITDFDLNRHDYESHKILS